METFIHKDSEQIKESKQVLFISTGNFNQFIIFIFQVTILYNYFKTAFISVRNGKYDDCFHLYSCFLNVIFGKRRIFRYAFWFWQIKTFIITSTLLINRIQVLLRVSILISIPYVTAAKYHCIFDSTIKFHLRNCEQSTSRFLCGNFQRIK